MLTIQNINRIVGMICNGHTIMKVDEHSNQYHNDYIFCFMIPNGNSLKIPLYVHLNRLLNPNNTYRLFVMGWAAATEIEVNRNDMVRPDEFSTKIREVIEKWKIVKG